MLSVSLGINLQRQDFLGLAIGCDIACSMCFFFIVIWMKRKERENVVRITKDQIKALDYTVQLVHIPRHKDIGKLREEVRTVGSFVMAQPLACYGYLEPNELVDRFARTWRKC